MRSEGKKLSRIRLASGRTSSSRIKLSAFVIHNQRKACPFSRRGARLRKKRSEEERSLWGDGGGSLTEGKDRGSNRNRSQKKKVRCIVVGRGPWSFPDRKTDTCALFAKARGFRKRRRNFRQADAGRSRCHRSRGKKKNFPSSSAGKRRRRVLKVWVEKRKEKTAPSSSLARKDFFMSYPKKKKKKVSSTSSPSITRKRKRRKRGKPVIEREKEAGFFSDAVKSTPRSSTRKEGASKKERKRKATER